MSKTLIKPVENEDFRGAQNSKSPRMGTPPDSSFFILHSSFFILHLMKNEE